MNPTKELQHPLLLEVYQLQINLRMSKEANSYLCLKLQKIYIVGWMLLMRIIGKVKGIKAEKI